MYCIKAVARVELAHDVLHMIVDRAGADMELLRNRHGFRAFG
jgi:hypothetical protein